MAPDSEPAPEPKTWDDALVALFKFPSVPEHKFTQEVMHPDDRMIPKPILANPPPEEFAPTTPVQLRPMPGSQLPKHLNTPWGLRGFGSIFVSPEGFEYTPAQIVTLNAGRGAVLGCAINLTNVLLTGATVFGKTRRMFLPWYTPKYFHGAVKDLGHLYRGTFWGAAIFGSASLVHQTAVSMRDGEDDGVARAAGGVAFGLAYGFYRGMMSTAARIAIPLAIVGYASTFSAEHFGVTESAKSYIPVSYKAFNVGNYDKVKHMENETWPPPSWVELENAPHSWKPPAVHEPGTPIKFTTN